MIVPILGVRVDNYILFLVFGLAIYTVRNQHYYIKININHYAFNRFISRALAENVF